MIHITFINYLIKSRDFVSGLLSVYSVFTLVGTHKTFIFFCNGRLILKI